MFVCVCVRSNSTTTMTYDNHKKKLMTKSQSSSSDHHFHSFINLSIKKTEHSNIKYPNLYHHCHVNQLIIIIINFCVFWIKISNPFMNVYVMSCNIETSVCHHHHHQQRQGQEIKTCLFHIHLFILKKN